MQLSGPRLFPSKSMIDGDGSEPLYSSDRRVQVVTPSFSELSCGVLKLPRTTCTGVPISVAGTARQIDAAG
jgi:hypothetical protein